MKIKHNQDGSVTINATQDEYRIICGSIVGMYNDTMFKFGYTNAKIYKPLIDDMNEAEQTAKIS